MMLETGRRGLHCCCSSGRLRSFENCLRRTGGVRRRAAAVGLGGVQSTTLQEERCVAGEEERRWSKKGGWR